MEIQIIVLIVLSVMLVIKIAYLVAFKRSDRQHHNPHGQHHDLRP